MIAIVSIIGVLVVIYLLFTNYYPSFGGDVSKEQQKTYQLSSNYKDGKFRNSNDVPKEMSLSETLSLVYTFFTTKVPNGRPTKDIIPQHLNKVNTLSIVHLPPYYEAPARVHTHAKHQDHLSNDE